MTAATEHGTELPILKDLSPFSKPAGWLFIAPLFPHETPLWLRFSGKESACNAGDPGSIPGLGRSPGVKNGYPLQYSCLENPMDKGLRSLAGYSPWNHKESDRTEQLTHFLPFMKLKTIFILDFGFPHQWLIQS